MTTKIIRIPIIRNVRVSPVAVGSVILKKKYKINKQKMVIFLEVP